MALLSCLTWPDVGRHIVTGSWSFGGVNDGLASPPALLSPVYTTPSYAKLGVEGSLASWLGAGRAKRWISIWSLLKRVRARAHATWCSVQSGTGRVCVVTRLSARPPAEKCHYPAYPTHQSGVQLTTWIRACFWHRGGSIRRFKTLTWTRFHQLVVLNWG